MPINDTKSHIIKTAIKLFNKKGTQAVATRHIAKELGFSSGNLYYHFRNKEEIIRAIYDLRSKELDSVWTINAHEQKPSFNQFLEIQNSLYHFLWEYRFIHRELIVLLRNDPWIKRKFRAVQKQRLIEIDNFLKALIKARVLHGLDDPETRTLLIKNVWLIADNWLNFLDLEGRSINRKSIQEGLDMIILIFKPYLSKKALKELTEETSPDHS